VSGSLDQPVFEEFVKKMNKKKKKKKKKKNVLIRLIQRSLIFSGILLPSVLKLFFS